MKLKSLGILNNWFMICLSLLLRKSECRFGMCALKKKGYVVFACVYRRRMGFPLRIVKL